MAANSTAMTTNWNRVAQSEPSQARISSKATAIAATACGSSARSIGGTAPTRSTMAATASPKPMA